MNKVLEEPKKEEQFSDDEVEEEEEEDEFEIDHEGDAFSKYQPREMQSCPYLVRKEIEDANAPKKKKKGKKKKKKKTPEEIEEEERAKEEEEERQKKLEEEKAAAEAEAKKKGKKTVTIVEEPPKSPKKKKKKKGKKKKKVVEVIPPVPMPTDPRFDLPNLLNDRKVAATCLTTESLETKKEVFDKTNQIAIPFSNISPQTQFMGNEREDEWNRRKVKQLDDIPFEEDDEIEELKHLK